MSSINLVESNGGRFDGNNIHLERNKEKAILIFSIGWGDCPSCCIGGRKWTFEIIDNRASFTGSSVR